MSAFGTAGPIALVTGAIIAVGVLIYQQISANSRNSYGYTYEARSEPQPSSRTMPHRKKQRHQRTSSSRASSASAQPQAPARDTRKEIVGCPICLLPMSDATIQLPNCRHIFHDECFTIWRHAVVMMNPHAILCPTCNQV